jgi:hypothetical protein
MWAEVPILRQDVLAVLVCKEVCDGGYPGKEFPFAENTPYACHRACGHQSGVMSHSHAVR